MKEATGELNMTVVTIVAIGLILAAVYFLLPRVLGNITNGWESTTNTTLPNSYTDVPIQSGQTTVGD